jgi:hypothetical protein
MQQIKPQIQDDISCVCGFVVSFVKKQEQKKHT